MDINFRGLNIMYYDVLVMDGKRYLLDSNSVTSKSYYWGFMPKEFEVSLAEIDEGNNNFDQSINLGNSIWRVVGIGIGLVTYGIGKSIFQFFQVSQKPLLKLGLFLSTFLIAYLIHLFIARKSKKQVENKLLPDSKKYKAVFRNSKIKHQFHAYFFIIVHFVCFIAYYASAPGTEVAPYFINIILAYGFIWIESGIIPLTYAYQKGYIKFEKIEEYNII